MSQATQVVLGVVGVAAALSIGIVLLMAFA